jgi:hypothetical protein
MTEKLFIVYLHGSEDPMDACYHQTVRASRVEVINGGLVFTNSEGGLSAYFELSVVRNWREADDSEMQGKGPH